MNRSFVEVLRERADACPDRLAFTRWSDNVLGERHVTYGALDAQARAVAGALQDQGLAGERVLLLSTPGLEYVAAFLGCLYAGVVPVPYYPPSGLNRTSAAATTAARHARGRGKLDAVARAAQVAAVMTHLPGDSAGDDDALREEWFGRALRYRDLAAADPAAWTEISPAPDRVAFLQFTSGSTGTPRGVMVTHANLIHNSGLIKDAFGHTDTLVGAIWLPPYHDMGLIGGILQPIFCGGRCVLLAPAEFLQRPRRWLEAITRHRATTSGGPDFAYDLCARRVTVEQRDGLDLSSWTVAFTGAEPINAATLGLFGDAFGDSKFNRRAFFPCYGLAEATLAVTGVARLAGADVESIDRDALARQEVKAPDDGSAARHIVGCGAALGGQDLSIVDPESRRALPGGRIGEIWLRGPSVAAGYWNDAEATGDVFGAMRADGTGPFLRTGDLGYADAGGRLFIVGRRRDLIIVRGTNHHPADIERTIELSHMVVRTGGTAAFGVEIDGAEQLAVVVELDPRSGAARTGRHNPAALNAIVTTIRAAILETHAVEPAAVTLIVAGSLPRTTSGKLERYVCRERFVAHAFQSIYAWRRDETRPEPAAPRPRRDPATAVERQIAAIWSGLLGHSPALDDDFFECGGHSLVALELVDRLAAATGIELPLRALVEHSTLEALARHLESADRTRPAPDAADIEPLPHARYEPFPLTDVQEAYLFGRSTTFELGGVATQGIAEFDARDLNVERFQQAIDRLIRRHDMLRAVVDADGRQMVLPEAPLFPLDVRDLSGLTPEARDRELASVGAGMRDSMMPPDQWPLFEIAACRIEGHAWRVAARFDLLIADLHSLRLLWRELGALYADPDADLPTLPLTFRDAVVHRAAHEPSGVARARAYWHERLPMLAPAPELPYVRAFRGAGTPRFRRRMVTLSAGQWRRIRERAAAARVTPAAAVLAAFSEVLATWSRHPRFTLTLTFFNRPRAAAVESIVGDFTSLLLVGIDASAPVFLDRIRAVQRELWDALDHRHGGGVAALRELARLQGRTTHALMPIVFTSAIGGAPEPTSPWSWLGDLTGGASSTPQVALDHQAQEDGDRLLLTWDSVDALFPSGMVDDMFDAYRSLLEWIAQDADTWTDAMPSLVPRPAFDAIVEANRTQAPLAPATLHGLVLARAAAQPDRAAIITAGGATLTYADLERRSCAVARWIQARRPHPDALVPIVMQKGWEQAVAALGVVRAGAAYLPIDPGLPDERRNHLLERGRATIALTTRAVDARLAWPDTITRCLVDDLGEPDGPAADPDDWTQLAYVIFTSGSTGLPKGVMIDHRGAVNTIADLNERFRIGPGDSVLGVSALNFDLSVYDIFGMLAAGGTLVLPAPGTERNPEHWAELARTHRVTLWNSVPALCEMFVDHVAGRDALRPEALRLIWMSGDWIPVALPDRARAMRPGVEVVSMGGATEASIWSILHRIGDADPGARSIPYGRAMRNQQMHVFDHRMRPRPDWVPGDICIGGVGVALGYWRDPAKTAASFSGEPGSDARLYRTGDVGRWTNQRVIEFLGREDGQVKIGGLRIELGEIEAALAGHPDVRQCFVTARHLAAAATADASSASKRRLIGYVVPGDGPAPTEDSLRSWLSQKLAAGLIPTRFVTLAALPLTPNGKVDLNALPNPESAGSRDARPLSPDETIVRRLWIDELGVEETAIGAADNFFDVGGTSLGVVRLARALSDSAGRSIPVLSVFQQPTIAGMALLMSGTPDDGPAADPADRAARRKRQLSARRQTRGAPAIVPDRGQLS